MSTEAALLAAIALHPGEDTPRLALADYYDEEGLSDDSRDQRLAVLLRRIKAEPDSDAPRLEYAEVCRRYGWTDRAEFIRVQCALAALPRKHDASPANPFTFADVDQGALTADEAELFGSLVTNDMKLLPNAWPRAGWAYYKPTHTRLDLGAGETPQVSVWFVRGFVERASCPAESWFRHADRLVADWPLRNVRLTSDPEIATEDSADDRVRRCRLRGRREVVLVSQEEINYTRSPVGLRDKVLAELFAKEWPGITFGTPGLPDLLERIAQGLGAPPNVAGGADG